MDIEIILEPDLHPNEIAEIAVKAEEIWNQSTLVIKLSSKLGCIYQLGSSSSKNK